MKKKILFVAHMDSHIANFHLPYLKWFQEQGYETHVASNSLERTREIEYCDVKHQIDFNRSPFSLKNLKAYRQFKKLVKTHNFELVHAHTPMGGLFARLAFRKTNTTVFYTAHGFHFLKGGSKLSWLIYYPVEKFLSKFTDEIITINDEDYNLALNKFSKRCKVTYVPGVGVDLNKYKEIDNETKLKVRKTLGLKVDDFVLVCVAEQTKGKNQGFLIKFMHEIILNYPNVKLLLVGYGKEEEHYKQMIKNLKLEDSVYQLGYREDIIELTNIADLIVSASLREGLPRALLEALAIPKPLLVSNVRGNRDVVIHGKNGFLYKPNDLESFTNYFITLYENKDLRQEFSEKSRELSSEFSLDVVLKQVTERYKEYLEK